MAPFVSIATAFDQRTPRNLEGLAAIYDNAAVLDQLLAGVVDGHLAPDDVANRRVLLKPNWVRHNKRQYDELCLRTHDQFTLAALRSILQRKPASVTIADAPVQGCVWDQVVRKEFIEAAHAVARQHGVPLVIKDFRRRTFIPRMNNPVADQRPLEDYVLFDLGRDSVLEPITTPGKNKFRVVDYHPDRLAESHAPGRHRYCIARDVFEHDLIITLPKVKTHQKSGLTNALKILVGINGDKDFLPHHRRGDPAHGGDCYPDGNLPLRMAEYFLDLANRHQGTRRYRLFRRTAYTLWRLSLPSPEQNLGAAWHGNDTTWRMVLDLNRIAAFGKADGQCAAAPQRTLYNLSDGIIGGEGDGPLIPDPLPLGVVSFSNHPAATDWIMALLMGFDPARIPLLLHAVEGLDWSQVAIELDSRRVDLADITRLAIPTVPAPGWVRHLKQS